MKKVLLTALIAVILATGLQANDIVPNSPQTVQAQEITLESIMAAPDDPNARIIPPTTEHEAATEKPERSIGMQIAGAVVAPVYIAGMVVTAIVVAPVWLVKKALGE